MLTGRTFASNRNGNWPEGSSNLMFEEAPGGTVYKSLSQGEGVVGTDVEMAFLNRGLPREK